MVDVHSLVLSYKRVGDGVAITDGWKSVVDQLGLKIGCLLVFTPFHPYSNFLLTTFNVAFDVVCKKKKKKKKKIRFQMFVLWMIHITKKNLSSTLFYPPCCTYYQI
ncbi:putative DNA-binding pseudobarrel domain superfamily [Helianthus anomalus]